MSDGGLRMRVYVAGGIYASEYWRDALIGYQFNEKRVAWSDSIVRFEEYEGGTDPIRWEILGLPSGNSRKPPAWPLIPNGFMGVADYVGPFGIKTVKVLDGKPCLDFSPRPIDRGIRYTIEDEREEVEQSFQAITSADAVVVFATTMCDRIACEVGYAYAKAKPVIFIGRLGSGVFDTFTSRLAVRSSGVNDSPNFVTELSNWLADGDSDLGGLFQSLNCVPRQQYYRSPWWRRRRAAALERSDGKCALCASDQNLEAHHNTYDRMYREADSDIVVLCNKCHDAADAQRRNREASQNSDNF